MKTYKILLFFIFTFSALSNAQINKDEIFNTIKFLAGKDLGGRMSGSPGFIKAADFITGEFHKLKLIPKGDTGYYQKFNVEYNEILAPEHLSVIINDKRIKYKIGNDYVFRGFSGSGKLSSPVVFCGYGIDQPDSGLNDYAGVDVKGKTVMVFRYNPKWNINGKTFANGNPREKAIVAAKHGAVAILFVSFPNDAEPQKPIGSLINGAGEQMLNFPEVHINLNVADTLFTGSGHSLKELQTIIDSTKKPFSIPLNNIVDIEVHTKYVKEKEVTNIVGMLEGSDPVLKNEYLIMGAHLDHVGSQAGEIYFPGANDNASGSAALLQIARAFVSSGIRPKRSVIFISFASEEQGLNGSKYFVEHMHVPLDKVNAMINFDCVGFGDSIQIYGGKSFPDIWNQAKQADSENDKLLISETGNGGGADAEAFFLKGIPTLYFVTKNSYKHLHQLTDTPETINQDLLTASAKLGYYTALKILNK